MKFAPFLFLILCFSVSAQTKKPVSNPKPQAQTAAVDNAETEDKLLVSQYQAVRNKLFACETTYMETFIANKDDKAKTDEAVKIYNSCISEGNAELAKIYTELSKRPNAIRMLITDEYVKSVIRANFARMTKSEPNNLLESEIDLQRIIVIQNQRIIELLERLVNKK